MGRMTVSSVESLFAVPLRCSARIVPQIHSTPHVYKDRNSHTHARRVPARQLNIKAGPCAPLRLQRGTKHKWTCMHGYLPLAEHLCWYLPL